MRLPLPDRFKIKYAAIFIASLFLLQQLEGTEIIFSLLVAMYLALFVAAFNVAGGLYYASGAYIFFSGIATAAIGLTYKALLGQPAQSLLLTPTRTMLAYCGGMAGMGCAAFVSSRLRPKRALLSGMAVGEQMKQAAIGCLALAILIRSLAWSNTHETSSLASALRQIDFFGPMAILLGTTYEITKSKGRRSTNWVVWTSGLYLFFFGIVGFSKEGMFAPANTWLIPCIVLRFNFSKRQLLGGLVAISFTLYYLVPYSQYVRNFKTETISGNAEVALHYLTDLQTTRKLYLENTAAIDATNGSPHFFKNTEGLFDRLQMLAFDDAIIHRSEQGYTYGLLPTYQAFANVIPRVFWPNKPSFAIGNDYGRELGVISPDDTTTGISFSPIGDAYHQAEWFGVLVVLPLVMFLFFFTSDTLTGDVRRSPWGLLTAALAAHIAPEGLLGGTIYLATIGSFGLVVIALLSKYVLPKVGAIVIGGGKRTPELKVIRPLSYPGLRAGPPPVGTSDRAPVVP